MLRAWSWAALKTAPLTDFIRKLQEFSMPHDQLWAWICLVQKNWGTPFIFVTVQVFLTKLFLPFLYKPNIDSNLCVCVKSHAFHVFMCIIYINYMFKYKCFLCQEYYPSFLKREIFMARNPELYQLYCTVDFV